MTDKAAKLYETVVYALTMSILIGTLSICIFLLRMGQALVRATACP